MSEGINKQNNVNNINNNMGKPIKTSSNNNVGGMHINQLYIEKPKTANTNTKNNNYTDVGKIDGHNGQKDYIKNHLPFNKKDTTNKEYI